jgi:putative glycosyltransferase
MTVRLMTRRYVAALLSHPETELTIAGLWARTGFAQVAVPVDKGRKPASAYSLRRKVSVLVNAVTGFSSKPLHYIFGLGVVMLGLSAVAAGGLIARRVLFGDMLDGWPSLMVSLWGLGGLIIFCQGVIGIYLSKVYLEVKRRPGTIAREVYEPVAAAAAAPLPFRRAACG